MANNHQILEDLKKLLYTVGSKLREGFESRDKSVTTKSDPNDLLTKYDIDVNNLILNHLQNKYPEFSIISEESPEISKSGNYSFIIDPIDGTRNFVRGIPTFFSGIGVVQDGEPIITITYNPIIDSMYCGVKNEGSYKNGVRLKVSERTLGLSDVQIRVLKNKSLENRIVSNIIEKVYQVKNDMCCHEEISGVASNRYDGAILKGSYPWDFCHALLVEEAGGKVTDWNGNKFTLESDNIVLSNGIIHEELLKLIQN